MMIKLLKGFFGNQDAVFTPADKLPHDLDLPCEVMKVPGKKAVKWLQELRNHYEATPILLGDLKDLNMLAESYHMNDDSYEEIVRQSWSLDVNHWLSDRTEEDPLFYQADVGDWPKRLETNTSLIAHMQALSRRPKKDVYIGLVPVEYSWKVPAYLKIGAWNECPQPHQHAAVFRTWKHRYGAEVACIANDVVEFTVKSPPTNKYDAMVLAKEQFVYCPDIVHQNMKTLSNLAASLVNAKYWYFWWD